MRTQSLKKLESPKYGSLLDRTMSIPTLGSAQRSRRLGDDQQDNIYDKMITYSQKKIRDNINLTRKLSR